MGPLALCRLDYMLQFFMQKGYRAMRFTRFQGQQRAINAMVKDLTGRCGARTLIGFGDFGNRDPSGFLKKCPAGPVKKLVRALSQKASVVMVDEFRSSKLCAQCEQHAELKAMRGLPSTRVLRRYALGEGEEAGNGAAAVGHGQHVGGSRQLIAVYSVRFCSKKDCNARVNRDVNAARNMLALLEASLQNDRPPAFRRAGQG